MRGGRTEAGFYVIPYEKLLQREYPQMKYEDRHRLACAIAVVVWMAGDDPPEEMLRPPKGMSWQEWKRWVGREWERQAWGKNWAVPPDALKKMLNYVKSALYVKEDTNEEWERRDARQKKKALIFKNSRAYVHARKRRPDPQP
jgi:hypothetical protein